MCDAAKDMKALRAEIERLSTEVERVETVARAALMQARIAQAFQGVTGDVAIRAAASVAVLDVVTFGTGPKAAEVESFRRLHEERLRHEHEASWKERLLQTNRGLCIGAEGETT